MSLREARLVRPSASSAADAPQAEPVLAGETSRIAHTDGEPNGVSELVSAGWGRAVLNVIPRDRIDGNRLRRPGHFEKDVGLGRFLAERRRDQDAAHDQRRDTRDRVRRVQGILFVPRR